MLYRWCMVPPPLCKAQVQTWPLSLQIKTSTNSASQPSSSAHPPQLARQGPLPSAADQPLHSIPHPQSRQQTISPQPPTITPDPPSFSPSESSASINPAALPEPKLARIGTKVVRDAFLAVSSKHPPKPTPTLGRESSPAVGGLSDGISDEQGGSAEPKTGGVAEGETVEEKQRRQKQEANRKSAEKRRKRKEEEKERLRLLEANGELPAEGGAPHKDDPPSPVVAPGATEGTASPSSSSEDRPIGALGGSSVNLAALGKGGTPPVGARAGSVPPAKKAPAKKATNKAAPPAGGAKKAPKPKGE
jgi:hypothetical protein